MNAILLIVIIFLTVIGDFFIKKAAILPGMSGYKFLLLTCFIWSCSVLAWFFLLRKMELSNSNLIYAVGTMILILAVSFFYFHEKITVAEIIGFILGVISIYLMARFA